MASGKAPSARALTSRRAVAARRPRSPPPVRAPSSAATQGSSCELNLRLQVEQQQRPTAPEGRVHRGVEALHRGVGEVGHGHLRGHLGEQLGEHVGRGHHAPRDEHVDGRLQAALDLGHEGRRQHPALGHPERGRLGGGQGGAHGPEVGDALVTGMGREAGAHEGALGLARRLGELTGLRRTRGLATRRVGRTVGGDEGGQDLRRRTPTSRPVMRARVAGAAREVLPQPGEILLGLVGLRREPVTRPQRGVRVEEREGPRGPPVGIPLTGIGALYDGAAVGPAHEGPRGVDGQRRKLPNHGLQKEGHGLVVQGRPVAQGLVHGLDLRAGLHGVEVGHHLGHGAQRHHGARAHRTRRGRGVEAQPVEEGVDRVEHVEGAHDLPPREEPRDGEQGALLGHVHTKAPAGEQGPEGLLAPVAEVVRVERGARGRDPRGLGERRLVRQERALGAQGARGEAPVGDLQRGPGGHTPDGVRAPTVSEPSAMPVSTPSHCARRAAARARTDGSAWAEAVVNDLTSCP